MLQSIRARVALVPAVVLGAVASAHAEVPAAAQGLFTAIGDDFETIAGYMYTAMAVVLGGFIVAKLIKKAANKAT